MLILASLASFPTKSISFWSVPYRKYTRNSDKIGHELEMNQQSKWKSLRKPMHNLWKFKTDFILFFGIIFVVCLFQLGGFNQTTVYFEMSCLSQDVFPCFQHFISVFPVIKRIRSQALHFVSTVVVLLIAAVGIGHLEWITGNANINLYSST